MAAAGSGISRLGDFESGHGCWHPVSMAEASTNVLVNKKFACKVGDKSIPHTCPDKGTHPDSVVKGSAKIFVNKKPVARIGDALSGGAVMVQGSHTVLAGG